MLSILTAPKPSLLICSWNHCIWFSSSPQPLATSVKVINGFHVAQSNRHSQFSSLQHFPQMFILSSQQCFCSSSRMPYSPSEFLTSPPAPSHSVPVFWLVASHLTLWHWSDSGDGPGTSSIYIHSLDDLILAHDFTCHLYADDFQMYVYSMKLLLNSPSSISHHLLDSSTWVCLLGTSNNMSQSSLLTFPTKPAPPAVFSVTVKWQLHP